MTFEDFYWQAENADKLDSLHQMSGTLSLGSIFIYNSHCLFLLFKPEGGTIAGNLMHIP